MKATNSALKTIEAILDSHNYSATSFIDGSRRLRVSHGVMVQTFAYGTAYTVTPNCPPESITMVRMHMADWSQAGHIWAKYWLCIHASKETTTFKRPEAKAFNSNNDYVAVYDTDGVKVFLASQIPSYDELLRELGYVRDSSLNVPFSQAHESYYDPTLDARCNSCGLARPLI